MAKRKRHERLIHASDYDGAWKEFGSKHFRAIIAVYFPSISASIDWEYPPQWMDRELSRILPRRRQRPRSVDLLAKVRLLSGEEQWILLHLEVQSEREADFEFRIFRYNSGLVWAFEQRVVTLVVLADLDEQWHPNQYTFRIGNFESRLQFSTCKLIDKLASEWENDHSLPVQVARAQIEALRTAGDPEGRYRAKWQLVRNLYHLAYTADEVREIFRFIDWMMSLRDDLSSKFEKELAELEESLTMPYITSVERIAEARGEAREETRGMARLLLVLLVQKCGPLPETVEQRVRAMSFDSLEELGQTVFDIHSLSDLQSWLDARDEST